MTARTPGRTGVRTTVRSGVVRGCKSGRCVLAGAGMACAHYVDVLTLRPAISAGAWRRRDSRPAPPVFLILSQARARIAGLIDGPRVASTELRRLAEGITYDAPAAERQAAELGGAWIVEPSGKVRWSAPARDSGLDVAAIREERQGADERTQRRIGDAIARPGSRRSL